MSSSASTWHQPRDGSATAVPRNTLNAKQPRVLIVDAERVIAEMLAIALNYEGVQTVTACDGATALSITRRFRPDLAIVDLRIPDMAGALLVSRLLESQPRLLTIFLHDKAGCLPRPKKWATTEDWLLKPFSIEHATSRVRRILHTNGMDCEAVRPRTAVGDLVLDEEYRLVWRSGELIVLTPTEFALMRFFVRNPRRVLSTQEILGRVWRYDYAGNASQVRLYVSYLRRRIDAGRVPMIHTVRRTGYVLKP